MKHFREDSCYILEMIFIVATFPVSVPYLLFVDAINEVEYMFYTPTWTRRKLEKQLQEKVKQAQEDAYKKTYAYRYSQKPFA